MAEDSEPKERPTVDSSLDKDPRVAISVFWHTTVLFFDRLHSRILAKYPRFLVSVDWLLEFLYVLFASPITALVVSLLLVPFVISGSIPIIVFCSVTTAWLLCVVAVARAEPVKQLSIIPRFVMVGIIAVVMFGISRSYIRWSLLNYYAHIVPPVSGSVSPTPSPLPGVTIDSEQLGQRLDELLRKEMRKFAPPQVQRVISPAEIAHSDSPHVAHSDTPISLSKDLLLRIVPQVTQQLRNWGPERRAAEQDLQNFRWEATLHLKENGTSSEERNRVDDGYLKKIEDSRDAYDKKLVAIMDNADSLRRLMAQKIPTEALTDEDRKMEKDFKSLDESVAADYLERLAKRI